MIMVNERRDANWRVLLALLADIHMLRLPGPCLGGAEPRIGMWAATEQNASGYCVGICGDTACISVCTVHAGGVPDGGTEIE